MALSSPFLSSFAGLILFRHLIWLQSLCLLSDLLWLFQNVQPTSAGALNVANNAAATGVTVVQRQECAAAMQAGRAQAAILVRWSSFPHQHTNCPFLPRKSLWKTAQLLCWRAKGNTRRKESRLKGNDSPQEALTKSVPLTSAVASVNDFVRSISAGLLCLRSKFSAFLLSSPLREKIDLELWIFISWQFCSDHWNCTITRTLSWRIWWSKMHHGQHDVFFCALTLSSVHKYPTTLLPMSLGLFLQAPHTLFTDLCVWNYPNSAVFSNCEEIMFALGFELPFRWKLLFLILAFFFIVSSSSLPAGHIWCLLSIAMFVSKWCCVSPSNWRMHMYSRLARQQMWST